MFKKSIRILPLRRYATSAKPVPEVDIFINGTPVKVPSHFTILQALRRERVTIPSFCFHERLSIAGNCRMCLVQLEGMPKIQAACAVNVMKGMKIRTNSPQTWKAQEGVVEFILSDHPLDCPICDQGGECDLQDIAIRFGSDRSRFTDIHFSGKRAVENKNLGPLIRTEMTRCIHCTRCIRFASQVCGVEDLGTTGRGCQMLVGTYVDKMFLSELSGNIIDLCPVGALTSKPYMFRARPWELKRVESVDVTDATGTNIMVNSRFDRVMRVLPRENPEVNQEWVSDKGRFAIDSLEMQRLVAPMFRNQDQLCPIEWDVALRTVNRMIKKVEPNKLLAVAGPHTCVETLVAAKDFLNALGSENLFIEKPLRHTPAGCDIRAAYSLNVNMQMVGEADKILLIGTNPRFEAPILNAWIRHAYLFKECDIYYIGEPCDLNYPVYHVGDTIKAISLVDFEGAKFPLVFVGISALGEPNSSGLMSEIMKWCNKTKAVFNVIPLDASWGGALEAGYKPGGVDILNEIAPELIISLGADYIFYDYCPTKMIYIGFQGDVGAENADLVLPGSAYTEAEGIYVNMEGRGQRALSVTTPPGDARQDWKIIRAISEYCGVKLFYDDHADLTCRMADISPNFVNLDQFEPRLFMDLLSSFSGDNKCGGEGGSTLCVHLKSLPDYYCTDVFSCNSPTMAKARKAAHNAASDIPCDPCQ